jgi:predicted RNA methylase
MLNTIITSYNKYEKYVDELFKLDSNDEQPKVEYHKNWKQNSKKGEVFTSNQLINELLDRIPIEVWKNPKSTFCDPCMGRGTFIIAVVNVLVNIYGYTLKDAKSRVYGYDIRQKYVNHLKRRGYKNVFCKDSLIEKFKMKFDVVLGNPPYQEVTGAANAQSIWPKFVEKSFDICKEGGYVCLIHPSGWRNVDGKFKDIQKLLLSKDVNYLEIHNEKDGLKTFGVETRYDWYVVKNIDGGGFTEIKSQRGNRFSINLKHKEFIPNDNINIIYSLLSDDGHNVEIISDSSYHHTRNYMSKDITDENIYPCVYTVKKSDELTFRYSKINNNGHFGIPKLIWSNGRIISVGSVIDENGDYALTQFSYAIVDKPKNLPLIKRVFDSKIFRDLMEDCAVSDMSINRRIIGTFRKDFWMHFLDENNNVIEPNFENVERV